MVNYKQLCSRCKKNYVPASWRDRYIQCYDCQKKELSAEIENKDFKKLFNIPEEFYKKNSFLRDIKLKYIRFKTLTERQISAFKETVKKMKESK